MLPISSSDAFLILGKWRENDSHLHVAFFVAGRRTTSPGWILDACEGSQSVLVLTITDGLPMKREVPLARAIFKFEEQERRHYSESSDRIWSAYLYMEMPDGTSALFAERATDR